jgi:hypothetical protein
MEIKSLFDHASKKEIKDRINKLIPQSQRLWGKMDVAQMLAHCQLPMGVATGKHELNGNFLIRLLGPFFKKQLYNDKPFKPGLPTDKSFKIREPRSFEKEKLSLLLMIEGFSEETMSGRAHPFFGKMTKEEWSKGMWNHPGHHLKQFGV